MSKIPTLLGAGQIPNTGASRVHIINKLALTSVIHWLHDRSGSAFQDLSKNILSLRLWPFDFRGLGISQMVAADLYMGNETYQTKTGVGERIFTYSGNESPQNLLTVGEFDLRYTDAAASPRRWALYNARYQVYCPYYGFVELDPRLVVGCTVTVEYAIDIYNGTANIYIVRHQTRGSTTISETIDVRNCTLALDLAVAQNLNGEKAASAIGQGLSMLGSVMGAVAGFASGNVIGTIGSIASAGTTASAAIQNLRGPDIGGGLNGPGMASFTGPQSCYIVRVVQDMIIPESFPSMHGRPLMATRTLGNLTGYTEVESVHMDGFGSATAGEVAEIERLLKSGVIL